MSLGDEIRARLGEGWSIAQVARAFGVTTNTVAYHRDRSVPPESHAPDLRHTVDAIRTREAVESLHKMGLSQAEIARRLGVAKSTVSYHARRLGQPRDERGARRYDWGAIQAYHDSGRSKGDCQEAFGFSASAWREAVDRGALTPRAATRPLDELFVAGSERSRKTLKRKLLEAGLRCHRCAACGLAEWRGQPLSLALHHVSGDRHDNRLENLELLCPNCHSQTENFAGRNRPRGLAA